LRGELTMARRAGARGRGVHFCVLFALFALACAAPLVAALYSPGSPVELLTPENFEQKVIKSSSVWVVEFYAPWCGHCKQLAPEYEKLAKGAKGVLKIGALDADAAGSFAQKYGVQGFPTIKIFGADKSKPIDYQGGRTAKDVASAALKEARSMVSARLDGKGAGSSSSGGNKQQKAKPQAGASSPGGGKDVVRLTASNFDDLVVYSGETWLVEFYAPWCGHCKNLAPEWAEAATRLKGKVKVGAVDCDSEKELQARYGVQGFPTIKVFQGGSASDYSGGRDAEAIASYALGLWERTAPPPSAVEVVDRLAFEEHCAGADADPSLDLDGSPKKTVCLIAFLPHILDAGAAGRKAQVALLEEVGAKYKAHDFGYLWVEGGAQPALEAMLGVGGFGYPALVAVSPKKDMQATLKGAFSSHAISDFVRGLTTGSERLSKLAGDTPSTVHIESISPWDGKDGVLDTEEEFDLSDLMGDEL